MTLLPQQHVDWFRASSPYIHTHRGKTFVLLISGEAIEHTGFSNLIHDIALLNSLGVRLVLVHGARPQIKRQLKTLGLASIFEQGRRITDENILQGVEQAVGQVRVNIETQLSRGLINTPMSGASLKVISGNFVTARPYGIRDGIDFGHTGEVRKVDNAAIQQQLQLNNIVLLSPIAYSPSGEAFNCRAEDIATSTAIALNADKLIFMMDATGAKDKDNNIIHQLGISQTEELLQQGSNDEITQLHLSSALNACKQGVRRAHMISHQTDGALLLELYTRDGNGTLITNETYEGIREANIDDVGGILELIEPLENESILSRRSREQLELEIKQFTVIERDGMIIACAALYPYENNIAEIACLAIHENYRHQGRGNELLGHIEQQCHNKDIARVFILTTRTAHWFQERGFIEDKIENLPVAKQNLYNTQRNSKIFVKTL
ncbi:MAG: amino-acid N-acetyltransferase [Gammaproteobacteria bacterium]|nr:amino-acid N-acetyltransferase [Gammaproteobacteria bacterium]MCW8910971.1 amino-acid N-acetyltransferase [Gammaproteobacteria bacterium]MCW9005724.1 amino-acid N-acetyltransferase [Gammaproteobacteria bacterium]MCW9055004.1 amino-acid N-acetyltransferase [Gammaproteobacteria bacterium]